MCVCVLQSFAAGIDGVMQLRKITINVSNLMMNDMKFELANKFQPNFNPTPKTNIHINCVNNK